MKKRFTGLRALTALLFFILISTTLPAVAQDSIPELWGARVHDLAKVLKPQTVDALEQQLKTEEDSTTNQIAILIVSSLQEKSIEEYSISVVKKWKLGTKKNDNGVLLLVAVDDHKMRIEVGMGLQDKLTDAQCNRIIRNEMAPAFRRGDYDAGVTAAIDGITKTISGEYSSNDIPAVDAGYDSGLSITQRIISGFFIFGLLGLFTYISLFSMGCSSWGLYGFLIPFYIFCPWVVVGYPIGLSLMGIYVVGAPIAKILLSRSKWGKSKMIDWKSTGSGGGGGGSSWGGSSSGSGWSSGSSGGGFSGGGGSFDGGGSSGSW